MGHSANARRHRAGTSSFEQKGLVRLDTFKAGECILKLGRRAAPASEVCATTLCARRRPLLT